MVTNNASGPVTFVPSNKNSFKQSSQQTSSNQRDNNNNNNEEKNQQEKSKIDQLKEQLVKILSSSTLSEEGFLELCEI